MPTFQHFPGDKPSFRSGYARRADESRYPNRWTNASALYCFELGSARWVRDLSGHNEVLATALNSVSSGRNVYKTTSTSDRIIPLMGDQLPEGDITIVLGKKKTDGTNRSGGMIGTSGSTGGTYSLGIRTRTDGNLWFYYGGSGIGSNRVSTSDHGDGPLTYGDDVYCFTVGPRGQEIWQNGNRVAYSATHHPTRTSDASRDFYLNKFSTLGGDLAEYRFLYIYDRQMSEKEIFDMSSDPLGMFETHSDVADEISSGGEFLETVTTTITLLDSNSHTVALADQSVTSPIGFTGVVTSTTELAEQVITQPLGMTDSNSFVHATLDDQVVTSAMGMTDSNGVIVLFSEVLSVTSTLSLLGDVESDSNPGVTTPLGMYGVASAVKTFKTIDVTSPLTLSGLLGIPSYQTVTSPMTLVGTPYITKTSTGFLNLVGTATASMTTPIVSDATLTQTITADVDVVHGVTHTDLLKDSVSYYVVNPCAKREYTRFEGFGEVEGLPELPLKYKASLHMENKLGDTVKVRNPEKDDRHRISSVRINRESRGGNLDVFVDPLWPQIESLQFTVVAVRAGKNGCPDMISEIEDFMYNNLGQEIILHDWDGTDWEGIILNPDEPATEDEDGYWTISVEFEGVRRTDLSKHHQLGIAGSIDILVDYTKELTSNMLVVGTVGQPGLVSIPGANQIVMTGSAGATIETKIMEDHFTGGGSLIFNSPDIYGALFWRSHDHYFGNGTSDPVNAGAYYPVGLEDGRTYSFEWYPRTMTSGDAPMYMFLGERLPASPRFDAGPGATGLSDPTTLKVGFSSKTVSGAIRHFCNLGSESDGAADGVEFSDATLRDTTTGIDLKVDVDTKGSLWKATWYAKATGDPGWTEVRSATNLLSKHIGTIGWSHTSLLSSLTMSKIKASSIRSV